MDLEQDYVFYALEISLTFLAISAAYMIDINRPITFVYLLPITVLFGYTAFASRDEFKVYSTLSLTGLSFMVVGGVVAAVAIFTALGNILVSIFSSGAGFRSFYGATSLPLLFMGMIMGASLFGLAVTDPSVANQIREGVGDYSGQKAEQMVERSNLLESQKSGQQRLVNSTTTLTFDLTKSTVLRTMARNTSLSHEEYTALEDAFDKADRTVKQSIISNGSKNIEEKTVDISGRMKDLVENSLRGKNFIFLVPLVAFAIYGLQPLIGIFTGIWASLFFAVSTREEENTDS